MELSWQKDVGSWVYDVSWLDQAEDDKPGILYVTRAGKLGLMSTNGTRLDCPISTAGLVNVELVSARQDRVVLVGGSRPGGPYWWRVSRREAGGWTDGPLYSLQDRPRGVSWTADNNVLIADRVSL